MSGVNPLDLELGGATRAYLEGHLLPFGDWANRIAEMPEFAARVVTGADCYLGCEGIGWTEESGWYLVLWTPSDDSGGPTKEDEGRLTLLFIERREYIFQPGVTVCPDRSAFLKKGE